MANIKKKDRFTDLPSTLSFNQLLILLTIKKGEKLFPNEIGDKIDSTELYTVKVATLYPILHRLERNGFINSYINETRRKKYSLSSQGEKVINTSQEIMRLIYPENDDKDNN